MQKKKKTTKETESQQKMEKKWRVEKMYLTFKLSNKNLKERNANKL